MDDTPAAVAAIDPATGRGEPDTLLAIPRATHAYVVELRRVVEQRGAPRLEL